MPVTIQHFRVGSVLPAVMYMLRRGYRRGRGRFVETFAPEGRPKAKPTVRMVAERLARDHSRFVGFDGEVEREILGDLLLAHQFENRGLKEGQTIEIQRVYATHFFASWIDLPEFVGHLRYVPELLVSLLADQTGGKFVEASEERPFPIGRNPLENALLRPFSRGAVFAPNPEQLDGDRFDESEPLSLDELVAVRVGRACGAAPEKLRSQGGDGERISNSRPLSVRATEIFREDLAGFVAEFGEAMPRRALTPMVECLIGLGLWHTFFSSLRCAVEWERTFKVPDRSDQTPPEVFVDASGGVDQGL
ncbi:MAG: hypothetical protein SNJ74_12905, partial [Fimbriimonadaceae bacterium]